jgi:two-component system, sensor histidine kinase and response regulator
VPDAVVGDQVRLRQILLNLAGNGIKFTEQGEVSVGVRVRTEEGLGAKEGLGIRDWGLEASKRPAAEPLNPCLDSQPLIPNPQSLIPSSVTLEFTVHDTGIGIPPSDLEHIFHPFTQADPSTTRRFGGTGLGLSICSNLVHLMDGNIWAESRPGQGSEFHFTVQLPLAKEPLPETRAPRVPTAATSRLRILLVEDNRANQKLASYILQDRGHIVDIANDGREAVAVARENRHDVILMDVQMPGMDGIEATKAIRVLEAGQRRVPIIAMTAHAMQGDREHCLAAGMDGYLSKPIDGHEMIDLIESMATGTEPPLFDPEVGGVYSSHHGSTAPSPVEATSAADPPVFDLELAQKRCFNNAAMVPQMVRFFFDDVRNLLPKLRAALQEGNLVEVGRLGHRLKGTILYLGAEPARQAAMRVERFAQHPAEQAEAEEAVEALCRACETLKTALAQHRFGDVPPSNG